MFAIVIGIVIGLVAGMAAALGIAIRRRNMHLWLTADVVLPRLVTRKLPPGKSETEIGRIDNVTHIFLAVCDHFEPEWGRPTKAIAGERVERWVREYPRRFQAFHDSDGRVPQHTFFFPAEEYQPEYLDGLSDLCRRGFGDVDIHLHHDNDTPDALREKLETFKETLVRHHGLLRRDEDGRVVYGFIHGNWALCNSRADGRWCGVDQELTVLRETGCYADFTLPSAPSETQTRMINSIYYAADRPGHRKSHDWGVRAQVGRVPPRDSLLLIQGPLQLDWSRRKHGILPRIENGDLHAGNPPSRARLDLWLQANVHVLGRPEWKFIKLHTHGTIEKNTEILLGDPMERFHASLTEFAASNPNIRFHYVTAWEMAQLVHQAEENSAVQAKNQVVGQNEITRLQELAR